jgi:hypothetical protein
MTADSDLVHMMPENCLLTASLKLCRGRLEKHYQAVRSLKTCAHAHAWYLTVSCIK